MSNNNIKSAIARIFTAVINADGIISQIELEYLNVLNEKYQLVEDDYENAKSLTFADAVGILKAQKLDDESYKTFVDDMEDLARIDKVLVLNDVKKVLHDQLENVRVHFKEALLCVSLRLALDNVDDVSCDVKSIKNDYMSFSKHEAIYVASEESKEKKAYDNEIDKHFDAICFLLQRFNYNFVYIPKIKEGFGEKNYTDAYKEQISRTVTTDNEKLRDVVWNRIEQYSETTCFTDMLFPDETVVPSILLKIESTQKFNRDGLTDFVLLKIGKDGVLTAIESFLKKYHELCEESNGYKCYDLYHGQFNKKSFHKTYIDFLKNIVTEIHIYMYHNGDEVCHKIVLGSKEMHIPDNLFAFYITVYYFYNNKDAFITTAKNKSEIEKQKRQLKTYRGIYYYFTKQESNECKFYENSLPSIKTSKIIREYFGKLPKYLLQFAPKYDRNDSRVVFKHLFPIVFFEYKDSGQSPVIIGYDRINDYIENMVNCHC